MWLRHPEGRHRIHFAELWRERFGELADVFGQPYHGWTPAQHGALWSIIALWRGGRLHLARFDVGVEPLHDAARADNQAGLTAGLPADLVAHVDQRQHAADQDGWFSWSTPLRTVLTAGTALRDAQVPPSTQWTTLPLEIGYCDPSRVWLHLAEEGGVARWPYWSSKLSVLLTEPRSLITMRVAARDCRTEQELGDLAIDMSWWSDDPADAGGGASAPERTRPDVEPKNPRRRV